MKIYCHCGHIIPDITDFLPYKAHFIADQDWDDYNESYKNPWDYDSSMIRTCYQCTECGRLYFDGQDRQLICFVPEGEAQQVLKSVRGQDWPTPLIAIWHDSRAYGLNGYVTHNSDGGIYEEFDDWETMKKRYFEVFNKLYALKRVRSAFLKHNEKTIHIWPPEN